MPLALRLRAEAVDDGGVRCQHQDAHPATQHSSKHQQWHAKVNHVAHDPGLAAPPDEQGCQHAEAGGPPTLFALLLVIFLAVLGLALADVVDGFVSAPQGQEWLPHCYSEESQHQHGDDLALLLDLVTNFVEQPPLALQDQQVSTAESERNPNERHPYRDTADDVRPMIARRPEGLVQPLENDAPSGSSASDDGNDVERSSQSVSLLTPPD
mmetsp:Transcript_27440/g.63939  ORF Transcript_27440/g.63939 Transcript_27440/m.63939 type:complete len:211 (-) Transcript_27440:41-673(-)